MNSENRFRLGVNKNNGIINFSEAGDPKIQIHLIPSWGMSIDNGKIACIAKGLVFNVDGSRSDSELRFYADPQQGGKSVISVGNKDVKDPKLEGYFENNGKIVIYSQQKIPKPQKV